MHLDKNSLYYRICPHCRKPHMVHNKSRDYCSDKCYNDFYSQIRKHMKIADYYSKPHSEMQQQLNHKEEYPKEDLVFNAYENNLKILASLSIDEEGTRYNVQELNNAGFEFNAYSYRYQINSDLNIYGIEYGPYVIFLDQPDTLLIHLKKTIK